MKKYLIGAIVAVVLVVPVTVVAYTDDKPSWTEVIHRTSHETHDGIISKFQDGDNVCYIAAPPYLRDTKSSISCVKAEQ